VAKGDSFWLWFGEGLELVKDLLTTPIIFDILKLYFSDPLPKRWSKLDIWQDIWLSLLCEHQDELNLHTILQLVERLKRPPFRGVKEKKPAIYFVFEKGDISF